ncbi:hypothetical protein QFZ96_006345 [Paraburkholderia youngii]
MIPHTWPLTSGPTDSGDGAQLPRHELILAVSMQFAFRLLARSSGQHQLENFLAQLIDRARAIDDGTAVQIDILLLSLPERRIRPEFQ